MRVHLDRLAVASVAVLVAVSVAGHARAASDAPDGWITTKVKMALLTTEGVSGTDVHVDTIDGRVTLHGIVESEAEKAKAERLAKSTDGVRAVRNLLQVSTERTETALDASDERIDQRVSAALKAEPALANSRIRVESVNSGVVLLSGRAATLSDAYRAVSVASRVEGVRRVASEIQSPDELGDVELWREGQYAAPADLKSSASDMWITTEAKMRLLARSETPGFDINVDTDRGVVTLFGSVDSAMTKRKAEAVVREVGGVVNVVNDLQVVAPGAENRVARSDEQILESIQERIDARSALDDSDIDVEVSAGVARLKGDVKSRGDQVTALTVARSTEGVKRVIDDLRLAEPPPVSAR